MKKLIILLFFSSLITVIKAQPLSQLPVATTVNGTDFTPVVQSGVTKKATMAKVLQYVLANLPEAGATVRISGDTLFVDGDTLVVTGQSHWSEDEAGNIANNNEGDVTLSGQVFVPDITPSGAKYSGNVAAIRTDNGLFPKSIMDLYEEQQDSLSKEPSIFGTFKRDTTTGVITPVNTTDIVKIDSLRGSYPGLEINQVDSILQDLSSNTGTDYTISTLYTAFKFTASKTTTYRAVGLWLKKAGTITNETAYLQYHLYSDNSGQPGTKLNYAWENIPYGDLSTSYTEERTQIGQSGGLTAGTSYWIVVQATTALPTGGGSVSIDCANTGTNTYATSTNGTVWTVGSNYTAAIIFFYSQNPGIKVHAKNYYGADLYSYTEYGLYVESFADMAIYAKGNRQTAISAVSDWAGGLLGRGKTYGVNGIATSGNGIYGYTYGNGHGVLGAAENALSYGVCGTNTTGFAGYFQTVDEYAVNAFSTNRGAYIGNASATGYAVFRGSATGSANGAALTSVNSYAISGHATNYYSAYFPNNVANYGNLWLYNYASSNDFQRSILITRANGGGAAASGLGGSIDWMIENSSGSESVLHARIGAITQYTTAGRERGAITFYTKGDANPPTLRMTIDSSGTIFGTSLNSRATNTFFGFEAGKNYVGTGNVFLGHRSGYHLTGSNLLMIANDSLSASRYATADGVLIFGDFSNNYINIFNSVAIGVAKTPAYNLDVNGTGYFSDDLTLNNNMGFVGAGQISTTGNGTLILNVGTGKVDISGDLDYDLAHGYLYYYERSEVIALTQNVYTKLTKSGNNLFTVDEANGITIAGDSITITRAGDYTLWFNFSGTGAGTNDVYRFKLYKNGIPILGTVKASAAKADANNVWHLQDLAVGDDISLYLTNTIDSDDVTAVDCSIYIRKDHD